MKGTASHGKKMKALHIRCRRCGKTSYHIKRGICSFCGYGKSSKLRTYSWTKKKVNWSHGRTRN